MKKFLLIALCLMTSACTAVYGQKSLTQHDAQYGTTEVEQDLIRQSLIARKQFDKDGVIVTQGPVAEYIRALGDRLVPADAKAKAPFNFYVLRDSTVNAFAFPNGDVYITYGLLARLSSEAQAAFILGHEISHIIDRHSLQAAYSGKDTKIAAMVTGIAVAAATGSSAAGSLAQMPFATGILAHSRANENEADTDGLKLVSNSGYRISDTSQFFIPLKTIKYERTEAQSIWATHENDVERIRLTQEFIAGGMVPANPDGIIGAEVFAPIQQAAAKETYGLLISQGFYEQTRDLAEAEKNKGGDQAMAYYYEGESWRMTAQDPVGATREYMMLYDKQFGRSSKIEEFQGQKTEQLNKSVAAYEKALMQQANMPEAQRGLGLSYYALGDQANGRRYLEAYLASGIKYDNAFITSILNSIGGH